MRDSYSFQIGLKKVFTYCNFMANRFACVLLFKNIVKLLILEFRAALALLVGEIICEGDDVDDDDMVVFNLMGGGGDSEVGVVASGEPLIGDNEGI